MNPPEIDQRLKSLPHRSATFIEPMECLAVSKLPNGSDWVYEVKLDGYRALAVKSEGKLNLFSRRRNSFNTQYRLVFEALADLPDNTVIDGEVVALNESGHPDFNLRQHYRAEASRIQYFVFDLLIYQNRDFTRARPLPRQPPKSAHSHTSQKTRRAGLLPVSMPELIMYAVSHRQLRPNPLT